MSNKKVSNKAARAGREARQQGESRNSPHDPKNKLFPTESDRRKDADWKGAYDAEDKRRQAKAEKKQ